MKRLSTSQKAQRIGARFDDQHVSIDFDPNSIPAQWTIYVRHWSGELDRWASGRTLAEAVSAAYREWIIGRKGQ